MKMCVACGVELTPLKNGVGIDFGNGHVYHADLWSCRECGMEMLNSNTTADFDPEHTHCEVYFTPKAALFELWKDGVKTRHSMNIKDLCDV